MQAAFPALRIPSGGEGSRGFLASGGLQGSLQNAWKLTMVCMEACRGTCLAPRLEFGHLCNTWTGKLLFECLTILSCRKNRSAQLISNVKFHHHWRQTQTCLQGSIKSSSLIDITFHKAFFSTHSLWHSPPTVFVFAHCKAISINITKKKSSYKYIKFWALNKLLEE